MKTWLTECSNSVATMWYTVPALWCLVGFVQIWYSKRYATCLFWSTIALGMWTVQFATSLECQSWSDDGYWYNDGEHCRQFRASKTPVRAVTISIGVAGAGFSLIHVFFAASYLITAQCGLEAVPEQQMAESEILVPPPYTEGSRPPTYRECPTLPTGGSATGEGWSEPRLR